VLPTDPIECPETWESEPFPLTPGAWHRFHTRFQTEGRAYWAIRFFDEAGAELPDHFDGIEPTEGWVNGGGCFRAKQDAVRGQLLLKPLEKRALQAAAMGVEPVSRTHARAWADAIERDLPPLPREWPSAPALPETRRPLAAGAGRSVLLLGDRIMNDVANGPWDVLLDPPGTDEDPARRVVALSGVAGSARFSSYLEENLYRSAVAPHNPDLILMGSRGSRGEPAALDALLARLGADKAAERLVLTDPFGVDNDPRATLDWTPPADWSPQPAVDFARIAAGRSAAAFDLRGAWRRVIAACDWPYERFLRDIHHANFRGRGLVARILADALSPTPSHATLQEQ
jgi:hypothetical protein